MSILNYRQYKPVIAENTYISPSASIIGKVNIGEDSSVWPMAVIRGDVNDINIGKKTNIQDGSILHATHDGPYTPGGNSLTIGSEVTIGHKVMLHACTIEDLSLIGIGSIVLDKAVIKKHALIAAGSLVPPGKVIEGGYLWVGRPVQKVRQLTEKEIAFFLYSADHYVRLKNNYGH